MKLIELCPTPRIIVWDITYACPLRCVHCYSESGRRPSKQLQVRELYQVTDAIIAVEPQMVVLAGGEPLLVKDIFGLMGRMKNAGIELILYTSGWELRPEIISPILDLCVRITVSIDGANAETHDRIRGRSGSFDRAIASLSTLNLAIEERKRNGHPNPELSIDFVVMQSNFHQLRKFCLEVVPAFSSLSSVSFGAVIPTGLASRIDFTRVEGLSDEQAISLEDGRLELELQSMAPSSVRIYTTDNRRFQMHPDILSTSMIIPPMQIEPDGRVRAMPIYEGTVGSLLEEPLEVLWQRAMERWDDPWVIEVLRPALTSESWAAATRKIDLRFGSEEDRVRIGRRPLYAKK